jgi:hypothetical protein
MVTIEVTFSGRIPATVTVGLGEKFFAFAVRDTLFLAIADMFFS